MWWYVDLFMKTVADTQLAEYTFLDATVLEGFFFSLSLWVCFCSLNLK